MKKLILYLKIFKELKKIKEVFMNNQNEKKTELWYSIGIAIVNIYFAIAGLLPAELVAKLLTILAGIYTIARVIVKWTKTTKDDEIIEIIEKVLKDKGVDLK